MKILLISVYFVIYQHVIFSQGNFELCIGGGSSNVLKYKDSEQMVEAVLLAESEGHNHLMYEKSSNAITSHIENIEFNEN